MEEYQSGCHGEAICVDCSHPLIVHGPAGENIHTLTMTVNTRGQYGSTGRVKGVNYEGKKNDDEE